MSKPLNLSVVGEPLPASRFACTWRECALYALGVGETDLRYTWEGHPDFAVLPSFAVVPTMPAVMAALARVGADLRTLVHGEQILVFHQPMPTRGEWVTDSVIREVQDKGKGAVVLIDTWTRAGGELLFETTWSIFCRGQGGFGGPRGEAAILPEPIDGAAPVLGSRFEVPVHQALLYRLSGDQNPLHIDDALARAVGFERAILHGLCTFGYAFRAALAGLAGGAPERIQRFQARFSGVVYPGETIDVSAVPVQSVAGDDEGLTFRLDAHVQARQVLSHGVVALRPAR